MFHFIHAAALWFTKEYLLSSLSRFHFIHAPALCFTKEYLLSSAYRIQRQQSTMFIDSGESLHYRPPVSNKLLTAHLWLVMLHSFNEHDHSKWWMLLFSHSLSRVCLRGIFFIHAYGLSVVKWKDENLSPLRTQVWIRVRPVPHVI
jgi:hypothetical protein